MPIIYTYPTATPTTDDLLLISDVSATNPTKATRKCTVGSLVALVGALVPGGGTVTSVELDFQTTGLLTSGAAAQTIIGAGSFNVTGILVCNNGGTGLDTGDYTNGDILYYDSGASTTQLQTLGIGGAGELLTVTAGLPSWSAAAATGVTTFVVDVGVTGLPGLTPSVAATGAVTLSGVLQVGGGGTGVRAFSNGYFVKGDSGTALTEAQYVDLTSEVTGILPVPNGGTGVATLFDGGVLLGSGTGAVSMANDLGTGIPARQTNGQLLIGRTGTDPVFNTLTAGNPGISIVNGAGTISISAAAVIPYQVAHNSLTLRGSGGGTLVPNIHQKGVYWNYGDYTYLQFYLEWDIAGTGPPSGAVIIENLPLPGVSPVGAAEDQGSCLITVNTGFGKDHNETAPTCGRVGVTGADEIVLRSPNYESGGAMIDTDWTFVVADYGGPWVLAGTAWWLDQSAT